MPYFGEPVGRVKMQTTPTPTRQIVMSVGRTSRIFIYGGMRDRRTKLARGIQLTDWSTARNLSNRSSGVQIPRDICTRFGRYLYSTKGSWIINRGYYTVARRYEFYVRVARTIALAKSNIKFISSS